MKDPLAIGLGALGSGIGFGGAVITLAQLGVTVAAGTRPPYDARSSDALLAGLGAGVVVAAVTALRRGLPLGNPWQLGVIAVLAVFGALLLGFFAAPVYHLLGIPGLALWTAVALAAGLAASRWSVRGSRGDTLGEAEREALQPPEEPRP